MTEASMIGLLVATVSFGALLYLAALGELISEKAGVLNLGVEGMMAMGAVSAFMAAHQTGNPWIGLAVGVLAGALTGFLHGWFTVVLGAEQVVSGLSLTILGLGFAAYMGKNVVGRPPGGVLAPVDWGPLTDIPWAGPVLFGQAPFVYLAVLAGLATWFVLSRTRIGLALRAAGESASTADAAGHSVVGLRLGAVVVGGGLAGASGAYLTLTLTPQWAEGITAGRGWIALALVVFASWRPSRVLLGAILFGGITILQLNAQAAGLGIPGAFMSMLPYIATIVVLVLISRDAIRIRLNAPACLGKPFRAER